MLTVGMCVVSRVKWFVVSRVGLILIIVDSVDYCKKRRSRLLKRKP